jgi:prepilin peptidase CpaA
LVLKGGVVALVSTGAVTDLRTRRIPNALTFGGAASGLLANLATHQQRGIWVSLAGWALGTALLLIPFMLRMMGGGDVKLLAAVGAWGGPVLVLNTLLIGAIAGSVMAIVVIVVEGRIRELLHPVVARVRGELALALGLLWPRALAFALAVAETQETPLISPRKRTTHLPYGPALAVGGIAAVLLGVL